MSNAGFAEWLLRRTTSRERAAAEVGDLLEMGRGTGWFWLSIAGLLLRQCWRGLAAFVFALYAGAWSLYGLMTRAYGSGSPHPLSDGLWWFSIAGPALIWMGSAWTSLAFFAVLRFGLRDRLAYTVGLLAASAWLCVFFWWQPFGVGAAIALSVVPEIFALRDRQWRVAIAMSVGLGLLFCCLIFLRSLSLQGYVRHIAGHGPLGSAAYHAHPSIRWVACLIELSTVLALTSATVWLHVWLMPRTSAAAADGDCAIPHPGGRGRNWHN